MDHFETATILQLYSPVLPLTVSLKSHSIRRDIQWIGSTMSLVLRIFVVVVLFDFELLSTFDMNTVTPPYSPSMIAKPRFSTPLRLLNWQGLAWHSRA